MFSVFVRFPLLQPSLFLLAGLLISGCARRDFFPVDARVGPGSTAALPATADSVRVAAGRQYSHRSRVHLLFFGRHYRAAWAAPVTVPVLRLATAVPGGLLPGKTGGGFQSISMTLNGADGREYALRTLDKEPQKTLPVSLRHSFLLNVVRDATSATLPYGALTVPPLAQAAGVAHAHPRLLYVRATETGLGDASPLLDGKVAMLEEKYTGKAWATPELTGATQFVGSEAMLKQVYRQPAHGIDQPAFLRARLLDVWLGDWDRHEAQWQWARVPQPNGQVRYQAIPKDRDQVYFRFDDGVIPWLAARPFILPRLHTFKPTYGHFPGLVQQAAFIDQRGLSAMTRADFRRVALDFKRRLPDSLIARAVQRLPPAVWALEGPRLAAALRARREALPEAAQAFYQLLARRPELGGTAARERFVLHRCPDSTTVRVFSAGLGALPPHDSLRFARTYYPAETRTLTLNGLAGDDVFEIITTGRGRQMPLRLYGGAGHDQLRLQGSAHQLRLFDDASELSARGGPRPRRASRKHRDYDRTHDK